MEMSTADLVRKKHMNWERLKQVESDISNILGEVANGTQIELDIRAGTYMIHGVTHPQVETILNNRLNAVQSMISTLESEIAAL